MAATFTAASDQHRGILPFYAWEAEVARLFAEGDNAAADEVVAAQADTDWARVYRQQSYRSEVTPRTFVAEVEATVPAP